MNKTLNFQLNPVSARIYLYSYKYKNGIKRYELVKELNNKLDVETTSHGVHERIKKDKLVEVGYLTYWQDGDRNQWWIKANVNPLIDKIKNSDVGGTLDDYDINVLTRILDSNAFRRLVEDNIKNSLDPIEQILNLFDMWVYNFRKLIPVLKRGIFRRFRIRINFKDIDDYDRYIEKMHQYMVIIKKIVSQRVMNFLRDQPQIKNRKK
jgi:hypothetical protein